MSKYISIGPVAVALADIANLSDSTKISILNAMFEDGLKTDVNGQIIQCTDLMFADEAKTTVVPFVIDPPHNLDEGEADPFEIEEEPYSGEPISDSFIIDDEDLPVTLRPSQLPPISFAS